MCSRFPCGNGKLTLCGNKSKTKKKTVGADVGQRQSHRKRRYEELLLFWGRRCLQSAETRAVYNHLPLGFTRNVVAIQTFPLTLEALIGPLSPVGAAGNSRDGGCIGRKGRRCHARHNRRLVDKGPSVSKRRTESYLES